VEKRKEQALEAYTSFWISAQIGFIYLIVSISDENIAFWNWSPDAKESFILVILFIFLRHTYKVVKYFFSS